MIKYIFLLLLLLPLSLAANITGTVYDLELNEVNGAIIEINTQPQQRIISKDGTYSLTVPPGEYQLSAKFIDSFGNVLLTNESITISSKGEFNLDLFVFDQIDEDILKEVEIEINTQQKPFLLYAFLILALGLLIYFWKIKKHIQYRKEKPHQFEDLDEVIAIMKQHRGRITQKDLRKEIPLSEAKVSLMITQLESEGRLKKIKKGRSNVLILN